MDASGKSKLADLRSIGANEPLEGDAAEVHALRGEKENLQPKCLGDPWSRPHCSRLATLRVPDGAGLQTEETSIGLPQGQQSCAAEQPLGKVSAAR